MSSNLGVLAKEPDPGLEPEVREALAKASIRSISPTILKEEQNHQDSLIKPEIAEVAMAPNSSEPKSESAALDRQKHIARRLAMYERTVKEHKAKTEADRLMDAARKLNKCDTFVVQWVDVNLEGEALGTRLKEGTNRKRAQTINLQYLNHRNHLLELDNILDDDDDDGHQSHTARSRSEDIDTEACARARSLQLLGDTVPKTEEGQQGDDMSERSSGTKRPTRSSQALTIESPAEGLTGADTSGTLEEEIADSTEQNESVYIRGSSKHIRPSQGLKVVEKEVKELRSTKSTKKEIDAFSTTDSHEQKAATTTSDAPKKKIWPALTRYRDPTKNVFPDYGPIAPTPKTPQQADEEMPKPQGGPKPMNRLGASSTSTPNPSFKSHRPRPPKAFDLTGDLNRSRQGNEYPAKRQRTDNGSPTSPIEVDGPSPYNSRHSGPSSARSGHSQTLRSRERSASFGGRDFSLQEIRGLDKSMRPPKSNTRKRNGASTQNGSSVISGVQRFNKESFQLPPREDSNDLIVDDDDFMVTETVPSVNSNKTLQIPIPGFAGSAFRDPVRQKANVSSRISHSPTMETAEASPYFSSERNSSRRDGDSAEKKHGSGASQDLSLLSQDDQDELAADRYGNAQHASTAQRLLKKSQPAKLVIQETQTIDVEESSEDEISKNSDIPPTNYSSSKVNPPRLGGAKLGEEEPYMVHQFFSQTERWLLPEHLSIWTMGLDKKVCLLSLYDASGKLILRFPTKEIEKLEVAQGGSRVVLYKSRTDMAAGATRIYVELASNDDSQQFFESLKSLHHTLGRVHRPQDHISKVFMNIAQKPIPAKKPRTHPQEDPADLRLAKSNAERLFGAKWNKAQNDKKASETANGSSKRNINPEKATRSEGLAREMRGRSHSSDILEVEPSRRPSNTGGMPPDDFYGNSRSNGADSHGTRSSGRVTVQKDASPVHRHSKRQRPQSLSPEPERWTFQNPDWAEKEKWKTSVVYPPDGKNKASVDMQDVQRLDEGEFLNDNLIVFYLRWLEDRLGKDNPELASRIYFTNTFFYERLTKHAKGKSGGINYEAVERWTSKIDLLKYDYIVVPVNETIHWYVAIICNAPKLLKQLPSEEQTSQPDVKNGGSGDESSKVEAEDQSASSPLKSPAKTLPDEVDTEMKEMSLDDDVSRTHDANASKIGSDAPAASEDQKDTEMVDLDPPPTNVGSDFIEQKPTQAKKGKRKSNVVTRKYSPDEPRIITLDSLGLTHSPTCTNLRKYLLREIKAKKNIEIEDPGSLGTTAKNIPQQDNHCDCGLFLLTYIEQFLKRPDGFVRDILQQNEQDFKGWRSASDMRKHIRDLLFDLQRQQLRDTALSKKEKTKSKQAAAKAGDKSASASSSKPTSREASKSVRGSPSPEKVPHKSDAKVSRPVDSKQNQDGTPPSIESAEKVDTGTPIKAGPSISNAVESHSDEAQSFVNNALGLEGKVPSGGRSPDLRASESQPITIDDSQEIDDNRAQAGATLANGKKVNNRKAMRSSPLPDEVRGLKHSRRNKGIEIPESPVIESKDDCFLHHHPLLKSNQEEQHDPYQSDHAPETRTKDSKHRSNGKVHATNGHSSGQDAEDWNDVKAANPDTTLEIVQLIDPSPRRPQDGFFADHQQEEDDEMLLQDTPRSEQSKSGFFCSSPTENQESEIVATNRSRSRAPSRSPRDTKRPSNKSADNQPSKKRKTVVDLVKDHPSPTTTQRERLARNNLRDSSDIGVLGKKANRMHFNEGV